jgi:hypothetical protein
MIMGDVHGSSRCHPDGPCVSWAMLDVNDVHARSSPYRHCVSNQLNLSAVTLGILLSP